ncbi:PDZ domain [Popillia japonica]|uniref:PDZ domain n=1 Tax=Popillia japonica TaxID=7064 RepID=A0AAW1K5T5_POPJA
MDTSHLIDPLDSEKTVIVIRSLVPGGVAQTDGRLIPGDRLIAVNDTTVDHGTLDKAVQILKSSPKGVVRITVAKPLSANDNASYHSQCIRKIIQEWTRDVQRIRWN